MNWKIWLKGLVAAILGGGAAGATSVIGNGSDFNGKAVGAAAAVGAITAVLGYLKQSPLGGK